MAMAHPVDHPTHSPQAGHALTFTPDHLVGATCAVSVSLDDGLCQPGEHS